MRQVSRLDLADITDGLSRFGDPDGGGFLDSLGRTRAQRVEKMTAILRNSDEADIAEMGTVFGMAMAKVAEEKAAGQGTRAERRRPDALSRFAEGVRQMGSMDLNDLTLGLENFVNPSARGMLDMMGRTQDEQVEKMAAMLRNGSEDDLAEMGTIFQLATAKVAAEQSEDGDERVDRRRRTERPRRRRGQTSAEWRAERRRAS